jgi:hypothetical protein
MRIKPTNQPRIDHLRRSHALHRQHGVDFRGQRAFGADGAVQGLGRRSDAVFRAAQSQHAQRQRKVKIDVAKQKAGSDQAGKCGGACKPVG